MQGATSQGLLTPGKRPHGRVFAAVGVLAVALAMIPIFTEGASAAPGDTDLSLTKADSVDPVVKSGNFSYTLTVTNLGGNDATAVTVSDPLPAQVKYLSATTSQGTCGFAGQTVTCDLGTVNAGQTATVTINVTADKKAGTASNTATVTTTQTDTNPANNSDTEVTTISNGPTTTTPGKKKGKTKASCATPTIIGTAGPDALVGTPKTDIIVGLGGNDTINGGEGNDLICSGSGNDIVSAGGGGDFVSGGSGRDRLFGSAGNDVLKGKRGRDRLFGNAGNDGLNGGRGSDRCRGGAGHDSTRSC
jgi:uncharacterized repeat protein (TIGR01451 family)